MNKLRKNFTTGILVLMFLFACPMQTFALTIDAKAAVLMDAATGEILFEQNADQPLTPASMTKVMTVYIAMDQVAKGNVTLDTKITVTPATSALSKNRTFSNVPLETNRGYTLEELLKSIISVSACGASKAVAEYFSGSEGAFAVMMNKYVTDMGLSAYFADSSGISNDNQITARSMAVLGNRLIKDFPAVLEYSKYPKLQWDDKIYDSTNEMLPGMPQYYSGVDGLKTGLTSKAKHCFTGTAKLEGVRLVGVVMGANSKEERFEGTKKLFDYGFALKNIHEPGRYVWAKPTTSTVLVNGQMQTFATYEIGGSNYIKLRDLALALNDTDSKFAIDWDKTNKAVVLTSGMPYVPVGGELTPSSSDGAGGFTVNPKVALDGNEVRLPAFDIGNNCYFKIRDLGTVLGFNVTWDNRAKAIGIDAN